MSKRVALGEAIKAIREAKHIPAATFATECQISAAHLCNIERLRRPAREELIPVIAAKLGVAIGAISYTTETEAAA